MNVKDGLVAIASDVLEDVQKEAEALIIDAENEAKKNLQISKEQADHNYLSIVNESQVEAEAERKRINSLTEVEIRNILLQTKEKIVDEAFQKAIEKLEDFAETDEYYTFLTKQIKKASSKLISKNFFIQVNYKDKKWLASSNLESLSKKLGIILELFDQTENFIGGCKIQTKDGSITYDGTIDNRLAELKISLRGEIANLLFLEVGQ
jgi:V/A-type H+-transporting ATPase subunit E